MINSAAEIPTSISALTITVTGTNDAPVAVADVNTAVEDAALVTGSVATNDSDVDDERWNEVARAPLHIERMDLTDALAKLPAGARKVFVLHDVEGYKHEEIAEMCGITSGGSKAQLHRARLLLREALER